MSKASSKMFWKKFKTLIIRFIKFNLVGTAVFLVASAIYAVSFNTFGFWTWMVANGVGAVLQFSIIIILNRTERGRIFDTCSQNSAP